MNTWKQTLVAAVVMALVAACLVWYLERFNTDKLVAEMQRYLRKQDDFRAEYPDTSPDG